MKKNILETPVLRFFAEVADLMVLNVLTILCSLPIITIGAATSALHTILIRKVRKEDPTILKPYFRAFRDNFKQATLLWLPMLFVLAAITLDYIFLKDLGGIAGALITTLLAIAAVLWQAMFVYVFPLQAHFENTNRQIFKNARLMALGAFPRTVVMVVLSLIPLAILYFIGDLFLPFLLMLGISVPAFLCAKIYVPFFQRFEPEAEETAETDEPETTEEGSDPFFNQQ